MNAQLKRGILEICILQLLLEKDMYGYDIVKKMQSYFEDTEESTLYTIMRRLNSEELTMMYCSEISNGPTRKYYRITDKGKKRIAEGIYSWKKIERVFLELGMLSENNNSKEGKNEENLCDVYSCCDDCIDYC